MISTIIRISRLVFLITVPAFFFGASIIGCLVENNTIESKGSPEVETDDRASLTLSVTRIDRRAAMLEVALKYNRGNANRGPRLMELFLQHSDSLKYVSCVSGQAILSAGKELVSQIKQNARLRTLVYSTSNLSELESGTIATYVFQISGSDEAAIEILTDSPIFAPPEANRGLIVSDPLTISFD